MKFLTQLLLFYGTALAIGSTLTILNIYVLFYEASFDFLRGVFYFNLVCCSTLLLPLLLPDTGIGPQLPFVDIRMVLANKSGRVALVTGGSIVTFKELINEVITPGFLDTLAHHGFTALILQCGDYVHEVDKKVAQLGHVKIEIRTFAWDSNLLETMKLCRGEAGGRPAGVVISHAGTGTIGDCFKLNLAQIVVANFHLMDDHQTPFAPVIAREHANIVHGHIGKLAEAVPQAIEAIEELGLDELGPFGERIFPVSDQDRITLIDQVIALD